MTSRYAYASALTGLALLGAGLSTPAAGEMTGNRYNLTRAYTADVSAAEAYLMTSGERFPILKRLRRHRDRTPAPVIIDVRTVEEHLNGHPPGAYSIPFPRVQSKPDKLDFIGYDVSQDAEKRHIQDEKVGLIGFGAARPQNGIVLEINHFVDYVKSKFPDPATPMYLLCKTGYRSVQAANALVEIGEYNLVYNVYHGYEGKPVYAYDKKSGEPLHPPVELDMLNGTKVEGGKTNLDGWANFQSLPTTTKVQSDRIDLRFTHLYY